jgi:hypothetical protein
MEKKLYDVQFTEHEMSSLSECLAVLRKKIETEFQYTSDKLNEPVNDPIFIAACKLQYKIDTTTNPNLGLTLEDYLVYGRYNRFDS